VTQASKAELARLLARLQQASGSDRDLDRAIRRDLEPSGGAGDESSPVPAYSGSVPLCMALVRRLLPDWRLHLGYGVNGIFPYAALSHRGNEHFEAMAPSVPLAILRALVEALRAGRRVPSSRPTSQPSAGR